MSMSMSTQLTLMHAKVERQGPIVLVCKSPTFELHLVLVAW